MRTTAPARRARELGSISGGPLLGLLVIGLAAAIVSVYMLPGELRSSPSLAAVAAYAPLWLAVAAAAAAYTIPIALAALQWRGFTDRESPRDKAIAATGTFGFAPGVALGALLGGRVVWVLAGAAAGIAGGFVIAAILRASFGTRPPPGDGASGSTT